MVVTRRTRAVRVDRLDYIVPLFPPLRAQSDNPWIFITTVRETSEPGERVIDGKDSTTRAVNVPCLTGWTREAHLAQGISTRRACP
jgi:hypothetical protein